MHTTVAIFIKMFLRLKVAGEGEGILRDQKKTLDSLNLDSHCEHFGE